MSNNKQSSVQYLIEQLLPKALSAEQFYHIQQAKAMHEEEMKEMYLRGIENYDPTFKIKDNKIQGGKNEQQ